MPVWKLGVPKSTFLSSLTDFRGPLPESPMLSGTKLQYAPDLCCLISSAHLLISGREMVSLVGAISQLAVSQLLIGGSVSGNNSAERAGGSRSFLNLVIHAPDFEPSSSSSSSPRI